MVLELASRRTGRLRTDWVSRMTDSANSSQLWPKELIEQAIGIIMNGFDLNAAQALTLLRRMSQDTRTQMCVVAEQIINHNVLVEVLRDIEEDVLGLG
jgi:AmiR/NasT family two-component response regulator